MLWAIRLYENNVPLDSGSSDSTQSTTVRFNHKIFYGCWRLFWAAYHVTWVLLSWVLEPWAAYPVGERVKWFIYLTNWTYLLLTVQTVLQAVNFLLLRVFSNDLVKGKEQLSLPWNLKLQWFLHNVVSTGSLMVTAWYWTVLYKNDKEIGAVSISLHAVNSVYVVLNLLITANPTRLLHFIHPVLFGVAYTLFSAVYQTAGGTNMRGEPYIYPVIDWTTRPWKTLLVSSLSNFLAIPLVHLLLFALQRLALRLWTCWRGTGPEGRGVSGRSRGHVACLDQGERAGETSSVQGEPLVSAD